MVSRKSGFTLIELLVVIAIIAILAAILFPVFAQARESARKTSCISNEKQLGLGFLMYTQDYDETFPLRTPAPGFEQTWITQPPEARAGNVALRSAYWIASTNPYIKNYQVWQCPSTPQTTFIDPTPANPIYYWSYSFNTLLGAYSQAGVVQPAGCPLLWEGYGKAASKTFSLNQPFDSSTKPWPAVYADPTSVCNSNFGMWGFGKDFRVHQGGSNFAYSDGHAKFILLQGDYKGHPFSRFSSDDGTGFYYWTDGCSPWYFRPTRNDG